MRLALINREKLQALGSALVAEFDNLVARIRTGWGIEHNETGGHTTVTAETVTTGRLVFSDIVTDQLNVPVMHNYDPGGLETASVLRVNPAIDGALITGLHVPQDVEGNVLDGRVLILENAGGGGLHFRLANENSAEGQGSFPRNRFVLPRQPAGSNLSADFPVHPATLLTLVYNATKARWVLASQALDNSIAYVNFATSQDKVTFGGNYRACRTWRVIPEAVDLFITGFEGHAVPEDEKKTLVNDGRYALMILHANTSAEVADRVYCPGGVRYNLHPRESVEMQRVRGGGWRLLAKAAQWIDVPYSTSHFAAANAGSWIVDLAGYSAFLYRIDGNSMTVSWNFAPCTLTVTNSYLSLKIPDGRIAARDQRAPLAQVYVSGVLATSAFVRCYPGGGEIILYFDAAAAAWPAAPGGNVYISGQITLMIRDDATTIAESHTDILHADVGHADAEHGDVTHIDIAHVDGHQDAVHQDAGHADVAHIDNHNDFVHNDTHSDVAHVDAHSDVAHTDQAHVDVTHVDTHSDVAHQDGAHQDVQFHDTPFQDSHNDIQHDDTHYDWSHGDSHADASHSDAHDDYYIYVGEVLTHVDNHYDSPHGDSHEDYPPPDQSHFDVPHGDSHGDQGHDDVRHTDVAHSDGAHNDQHSDVPAAYTPHYDVAHTDTHTDGAHVDSHTDVAHTDTHTDQTHSDGSHADIAHTDSHTDTPHSDTLHTDQGHQDAGHGDSAHQDQGLHTDGAHSDI